MTQGVSCLCLTYGRPELLAEAIESFLRQTWDGPKELIILNDHPEQTICCDSPNVRVFNIPSRLRTLGEKRNLSVALAQYDNLLVWDDDDIYLPWRIEETMKTLPSKHFFKCPYAWVMNKGKIEPEPQYNLFHGGSAFTRWLFIKAGGYSIMNGGEDADIEGKFQHVTAKKGEFWPHTDLPRERLYYIYRWDHGNYHTTGHITLDDIKPSITPGHIVVKPYWKQPYDELTMRKTEIIPTATSLINFICFSKNRPLQLEGYIRSFYTYLEKQKSLTIIYASDQQFDNAYNEVKEMYPWVRFIKQGNFHADLLASFNDAEYVCFGCDDVVFTGRINIDAIVKVMKEDLQFAFSLRLGRNIKKSMFTGPMSQPVFDETGDMLTWDLHASHLHGDFGYSWELNGTIYPADIAKKVAVSVRATTPNLLEAYGGGQWSRLTQKRMISSFIESKLVVPTVNVVQEDFINNPIGTEISVRFLLDAWRAGLRLDIDRYREVKNDCIHVGDFYLTKK